MTFKVIISAQACAHALIVAFFVARLSLLAVSTLCMVILLYKNVEAAVTAKTVCQMSQRESLKNILLSHSFTVLTLVVSPIAQVVGEDLLSSVCDVQPASGLIVGLVFGVLAGKVLRSVLSSHRAIRATMLRARSRNNADLRAVANRIQFGGVLAVISLLLTLFQFVLQHVAADYIASIALYLTVFQVCFPVRQTSGKIRSTITPTEKPSAMKPKLGSYMPPTIVFPTNG